MRGMTEKDGLDFALYTMIDNYISSSLNEALHLPVDHKFRVNEMQAAFRKHYVNLVESYVVLVHPSLLHRIMSDRDAHMMMDNGRSPEAITFNGPRSIYRYMSLPIVPYASLPAGRMVALRKGWFEFANTDSTAIGSPPVTPMSIAEFSERFPEQYCERPAPHLTNGTMIKLVPDKITQYEFEDEDNERD